MKSGGNRPRCNNAAVQSFSRIIYSLLFINPIFKNFAKAIRRDPLCTTLCEDAGKADCPPGPPRLPKDRAPRIPKDGAIPDAADSMPDDITYDETKHRLMIGTGFVDNVPAAVWRYEVSGKRILTQWFSYRKRNRERSIIGDRRPSSATSNPTTGWPSTRPNCSMCCMIWRCLWRWNQSNRFNGRACPSR